MPFRLAKCSFRTCASLGAFLALAAVAFFGARVASATITVNVENYGGMVNGTNAYYSVLPAPTPSPNGPLLFYDYNSAPVIPSMHYCEDPPPAGNPALEMPQALALQVVSTDTIAPPSGQNAYMALQVAVTGAFSSPVFIPIAGYAVIGQGGNSVCNVPAGVTPTGPCSFLGLAAGYTTQPGTDANCGPGATTPPASRYFGGVQYTQGETLNLLFYPGDLCAALPSQVSGSTGVFPCTTSATGPAVTPTTNAPAQFTIRAVVVYAPNDWQSAPPSPVTAASTSANIILSFQNDINSTACPSDSSTAIFPGDSQIQVNSGAFSLTQANPSEDAPGIGLIVLAQPSPTPPNTTAAAGGLAQYAPPTNAVGFEISLNGSSQYVPGFQDSTVAPPAPGSPIPPGDIPYSMQFLVKDAAGEVWGPPESATPATGGTCTATGYAYQIFGFLQSSRCFIATAAFRDMNVAPVAMLREFRDAVLLHHAWGRSFVHAYYRWSPRAAVWLVLNPSFRFPVLLILAPIEAIAWLALHPITAVSIFVLSLILLVTALHATRPRPKRVR